MDGTLFRPEVVAARAGTHLGAINITTKTSQKLIAMVVFIFVVFCVVVLFFGRYSRRITIGGELVPLQMRTPVAAERATAVCRMLVSAGQTVSRGTPLMTLAPAPASCAAATTFYAPTAGTVAGQLPADGDLIQANQRLLEIVQDNAGVGALMLVPGSALTHVGVGDRVTLQIDAFPYRKYGRQPGRIASIGDQPQRASGSDPNSFYELHVTLDRPDVQAYGREVELRPGMRARASLRLETRRIIEWIFEPLYVRRIHSGGAVQ